MRCSTSIRQVVRARNADTSEEREVQFGVRINLGNVIVERTELGGENKSPTSREIRFGPVSQNCQIQNIGDRDSPLEAFSRVPTLAFRK